MKKTILLLCLATQFALSGEYLIKTVTPLLRVPARSFYIDSISCSMVDTLSFGTASVSFLNIEREIQMDSGLTKVIKHFVRYFAIPKDEFRKIDLQIDSLRFFERRDDYQEYAISTIMLSFYEDTGESRILLFKTSCYTQQASYWDATQFHGHNLSIVLNQGIADFNQFLLLSTPIKTP